MALFECYSSGYCLNSIFMDTYKNGILVNFKPSIKFQITKVS